MVNSMSQAQITEVNNVGVPKIILGISCWDSVKPATINIMTNLTNSQAVAAYILNLSTLLPRSRNEIVQQVYRVAPDFTHILFLDADMGNFQAHQLKKFVYYDKDFVTALATHRRPPFKPAPCPLEEWSTKPFIDKFMAMQKDPDTDPLLPLYHGGMCCTLVKRKVFDAIYDEFSQGEERDKFAWFACDREPDYKLVNEKIEELVAEEVGLREGMEIISKYTHKVTQKGAPVGEDVYFCNRARELGFSLYCDCSTPISHVGDQAYDINDFLKHAQERAELERNPENAAPKFVPDAAGDPYDIGG
jgi:hypothetical protein